MKKYLIMIVSILFILMLFGCGEKADANASFQEATTMTTASPTSEPTEAPTTAPTVAPTPEQTVDVEAQEKAELNQRIQDFLNKEGEYTDEKLLAITVSKEEITERHPNVTKLGLIGSSLVQELLIDSRIKDDNLLLTVGLVDEDGNRYIICEEMLTYVFSPEEASMGISQLTKNYGHDSREGEEETVNGMDNILERMEEREGSTIIVMPFPHIDELEYDGKGGAAVDESFEKLKGREDLNKELFNMVYKNGFEPSEDLSNLNPNIKLVEIRSADDIDNVNLDEIPILYQTIIYYY